MATVFAGKIIEKIPNQSSFNIIAIYTDYKSDFTDEYTAIIGLPVSTLDEVPNGLIGRKFNSDHFQNFIAKGTMPKAVLDSWIDIWQRYQ